MCAYKERRKKERKKKKREKRSSRSLSHAKLDSLCGSKGPGLLLDAPPSLLSMRYYEIQHLLLLTVGVRFPSWNNALSFFLLPRIAPVCLLACAFLHRPPPVFWDSSVHADKARVNPRINRVERCFVASSCLLFTVPYWPCISLSLCLSLFFSYLAPPGIINRGRCVPYFLCEGREGRDSQ